jgi:hypothetical protein
MTAEDLDRCPSCQAPHAADEAFCWMCRRRFWDDRAALPKASAIPERAPEQRTAHVPQNAAALPPAAAREDFWTQPILVAAFILILAGLRLGSGDGTALLWLGLVPALFVTALAGFDRSKKKPETFWEKLQRAVTLLASALAIVILAAAAIAVALTAVCFAILAAMGATH